MNPFAQALTSALSLAIVSKDVIENKEPIGFLYHEEIQFNQDSGWRFFSGYETDEYVNNPENFQICSLSDVMANHPELKDIIHEQQGAWEWNENLEQFIAVG